MASTTTCDICNLAPAVGKVRVSIDIENATQPGGKTGRMEEVDSCESCRDVALEGVYGRAKEILLQAIPVHIELEELKQEIHALRKSREPHSDRIGEYEGILDTPKLPADHPNFKKDAEDRRKLEERLSHHREHAAQIDVKLSEKLARRAELHERTR